MTLDSSQLSYSSLSTCGVAPLDIPQHASQYLDLTSQPVLIPGSPASSQADTQLQDSPCDILDGATALANIIPDSQELIVSESQPTSQLVMVPGSPASSQASTQVQDSPRDDLDEVTILFLPLKNLLFQNLNLTRNIERNSEMAKKLGLRLNPPKTVRARDAAASTRPKAARTMNETSWSCIPGCTQIFGSAPELMDHLFAMHDKTKTIYDLAPLGLSPCPLCRRVYCTARGWKNHVSNCKCTPLFNIPLPQNCLVWKERRWTEGRALSISQANIPFVDVVYPMASGTQRDLTLLSILSTLDYDLNWMFLNR